MTNSDLFVSDPPVPDDLPEDVIETPLSAQTQSRSAASSTAGVIRLPGLDLATLSVVVATTAAQFVHSTLELAAATPRTLNSPLYFLGLPSPFLFLLLLLLLYHSFLFVVML